MDRRAIYFPNPWERARVPGVDTPRGQEAMLPYWMFVIRQAGRRLWLTVALYSVLGVTSALLAAIFGRYVPEGFPLSVGSDSVGDILGILASSMLAVATFSLSTLVTAYTAVAANIAPHAAQLLVGDRGIRSALASFVGAFIYAIVGIVAVHTGYYGAQGRVILFFVTLVVLALVVVAMMRWIRELSRLAQTDAVIRRVGAVCRRALRSASVGAASEGPPPSTSVGLRDDQVGFVQNLDLKGLEAAAKRQGRRLRVAARPGTFVHPAEPLLWIDGGPPSTDDMAELRDKFTIGPRRTFEQDPLFGFQVLGEIAERALSPGVNDSGTVRDVLAEFVGLLAEAWPPPRQEAAAVVSTGPTPDEVLAATLEPITRNAKGKLGVHEALQDTLLALSRHPEPSLAAAARRLSQRGLAAALADIQERPARRKLRAAAGRVRLRPL